MSTIKEELGSELAKIFDDLYIHDHSAEGALKIADSLLEAQKAILTLLDTHIARAVAERDKVWIKTQDIVSNAQLESNNKGGE